MKEMNKPSPPIWATRFLQWFCSPDIVEEISGDLEEEFYHQIKHKGIVHARLDYVRNVLGFIRPFAIKKRSSQNKILVMTLFTHFIKVAYRNIVRQKTFSAINIAGLALGMTCCLFIFLWIQDEKRMDNFHSKGDQLYNVYETVVSNNVVTGGYTTSVRTVEGRAYLPIADVQLAVPEIEKIAFYATAYELPWGHPETFQVGDEKHKFEGSRASADFFEMFDYTILAGQKEDALKDLSSIALSRKMAEIFFDTPANAIGKSIRFENRIDLTVTTVFENVPVHSSMRFDYLINWESHMTRMEWATPNNLTTLQLRAGADESLVTEKINRFLASKLDNNDPRKVTVGIQPFRDQYLAGEFENGKPAGGRIVYVKIFTGIAIFILVIACINFMNLATARCIKRAKEIGVRKVVGSSRATLIGQFLGESFTLSFVSLLLSVIIVKLTLPVFNIATGKVITLPLLDSTFLLALTACLVVTGFVAGSYPALFLSSLRPVKILKGSMGFSTTTVVLRKGLSVFQFAISIVLLIVMIVITRQTDFVQKTNLGYDRENLLYMRVEGDLMDYSDTARNYRQYMRFKTEALRMPGIAMVDRASEAPHAMNFVVDEYDAAIDTHDGGDAIMWEGKEKGNSVGFKPMSVGFDFLPIMNLTVAEGRGFSRDVVTDSADAFMVNEAAVKRMGMKDPIGKWVSAWSKKGRIIGVLKDYHTHSLHEAIKPLIIDVKEFEYFGVIIIRTEPGKTKEALASLEKVYKDINPNYPFSYQFVDQEYEKLYRREQVITKLSNAFAFLAITISCLGLLGLVMFSAEQRTREFSIRKVLGATVANIVALLSTDFLKLICISFCIAAPLGGYLMYQWLQGFAFKIELSWWIFAVAGGISVLIAFVTICSQAIQSAISSPVKSLRSE